MLLPINDDLIPYCEKVQSYLKKEGFRVDVDDSKNSMKKKMRNAEVAQYNYILTIGVDEMRLGMADVRGRGDQ